MTTPKIHSREFRRLRTQDERAPEAWRRVAESRPGFATYPDTREGAPSWWRRHGDERPPRFAAGGLVAGPGSRGDDRIPLVLSGCNGAGFELPPPPVDGETCKQWCGYCHLGSGLAEISADMNAAFDRVEEMRAAIVEAGETGRPVTLPNGDVITPRRRWWHRYTRRTR